MLESARSISCRSSAGDIAVACWPESRVAQVRLATRPSVAYEVMGGMRATLATGMDEGRWWPYDPRHARVSNLRCRSGDALSHLVLLQTGPSRTANLLVALAGGILLKIPSSDCERQDALVVHVEERKSQERFVPSSGRLLALGSLTTALMEDAWTCRATGKGYIRRRRRRT